MTSATTRNTLPAQALIRLVPCDPATVIPNEVPNARTADHDPPAAAPLPSSQSPADPVGEATASTPDPARYDLSAFVLQGDGYSTRVAATLQREKARMLVHRMYSARGYRLSEYDVCSHGTQGTMLEASSGPRLLGTLTLGFDSDGGLLADTLYRREIDLLRGAGSRLCELSQLAIDVRDGSRQIFASLIQLAYVLAKAIHRASDAVIEVNPRHAPFYCRMLGFQQIGDERTCPRVQAPAVLLHLDLSYMGEQIARYAGLRDTGVHTLYPYFVPSHAMTHLVPAMQCAA